MFVHRLKLRAPQILPIWIERAQLEQRIQPSVRVVAIVAAPGYGKTVLAARLYSAWTGPKLWYSLDAADADLAVFAAHLDSGIRAWGVELPVLDGSNATAIGSPNEVASRFAEGLAEAQPAPLLVFDDVHVLEGSRGLTMLNALVERGCRVGARFVLCGRSMPLALHGVAAAAQLVSLSASDLAFDQDETQAYLRQHSRGESKTAATLVERAEGWPAGIALIASTARELTRPAAPSEAHPSASDEDARRYLFDYLANEVLDSMRQAERDFLLQTAILDQLETKLCAAVADTTVAGDMLESLTKRGLFIARQSADAYNCHQLFREFLRHSLARDHDPAFVAELHRRAAKFLADRGDVAPAIRHHLEAGDSEAAALAFEATAFNLLRAGRIFVVNSILGQLDAARILASPTLLVAQARVQRERGEWDAALGSLERAVNGARAQHQYDVLAEGVRTAAPILASRNEFERLRSMLDEALALGFDLPESSMTSLRMTLAAVYLEMDRLDESLAIYREVTPLVVARGDVAAHGLVLHNTAVAHLRRGDMYAGLSLYERALKLKETAAQTLSLLTTLGDLVYVKTLLGDLEEAERLVDKMLAQALDIGATGIVARAYEQQAALKLQRGDTAGALSALRSAQGVSDPADTILLPEIEHGLAKCALLAGDLAESDEWCTKAVAPFRSAARHQQLAPILVTRAEIALLRADAATAFTLCDEAISEAGRGANALLQAETCLAAADVLVRCAAHQNGADAARADQRAAEAATTAIALLHQRDYRFMLRTKAAAFAHLHDHLRRWGIGSGVLGDIQSEVPAAASLRIEMLGSLRVFVNGREILPEAWKRRKALDIFSYLVAQRGRAVPRARLIDTYWPESDADAAHDSLRVTITAIRKAIGDVIRYENNAYRFVAPPQTSLDVEIFDEHIEHAQASDAQGDAEQARRRYEAATDMYRGDFLEDMQEGGWQWRERERLRAACIEALRWIARDRAAASDHVAQRLAVERILEVAPFDLEAVKIRLDSLAREMRLTEAKRDYEQWRARYRAAVGAEAPQIWHQPEITVPANA